MFNVGQKVVLVDDAWPETVKQIYSDNPGRLEKDQVKAVSTEDGKKLIIISSEKNFKMIGSQIK